MFDRFDETELLALIEDELNPRDARALRERLADEPGGLRAIEAMRRDRAALKTTREPELPGDLLAELEPMLARPMLMPEGDWRRKRRRRVRPPAWAVVAAMVTLAATVGLWALVDRVDWTRLAGTGSAGPGEGAAALAARGDQAGPAAPGGTGEGWLNDGSVIHHHAPLDEGPGASGLAAARPTMGSRLSGKEPVLAAGFVLVFSTDDSTSVEETLRRVLADPQTTSLVRNFDYEEAGRLERLLLRGSQMETGDGDVIVADSAPQADAIVDRPRPAPGRRDAKTPRRLPLPEKFTEATQLFGRASLAPSFERQLEFSQQGATYTISVPLARLDEVLARLQMTVGAQTTLRLRRPAGETAAGTWLGDYDEVRRAAAQMRRTNPDAVILLPVVVKKKS